MTAVSASRSGERTYDIAVIPGDGIGVDVTREAQKVVDAAADRFGFSVRWSEFDWSCERYLATGKMMPDDGLSMLAPSDAILLGAVGYPSVPDRVSLWELLIRIRRHFDQYVNLRPARVLPGAESPLSGRGSEHFDLVIVRENTEGEYSQVGGRHLSEEGEWATQEAVFTRKGIERVAHYAFQLAQSRSRRVASATKSNGIVHTMPFWDEVVEEVATGYPDVGLKSYHVDALAARMVSAPDALDVIVASNLFGDILSDLAGALTGGLGLAASGNINPDRSVPSMFESVHGSAPDIAGLGIADPIGEIRAAGMMLQHLGEQEAAAVVENAVVALLLDAAVLTPDLGGRATTVDVGSEIARIVAEGRENS